MTEVLWWYLWGSGCVAIGYVLGRSIAAHAHARVDAAREARVLYWQSIAFELARGTLSRRFHPTHHDVEPANGTPPRAATFEKKER